jgi:hypothetical protein
MAGKTTTQNIKSMLKNNQPGYYPVGNSLYFRISKERTGFWVVRIPCTENAEKSACGNMITKFSS